MVGAGWVPDGLVVHVSRVLDLRPAIVFKAGLNFGGGNAGGAELLYGGESCAVPCENCVGGSDGEGCVSDEQKEGCSWELAATAVLIEPDGGEDGEGHPVEDVLAERETMPDGE